MNAWHFDFQTFDELLFILLFDFTFWLPFEFSFCSRALPKISAKQVFFNLKQWDQYISTHQWWRTYLCTVFWWMPHEMNAARCRKKAIKNIMICDEKEFSGQFFPLLFRRGSLESGNEIKKEQGTWNRVFGRRRGTKNVNKNAIKGVNKRIFFVFSIIIFNNVLLQLPIFYQTIQRMFYSFHKYISNEKC